MKKELLRWDLNPRHTAYKADALLTELPRQLSWLGRIKAIQSKGNSDWPPLIHIVGQWVLLKVPDEFEVVCLQKLR